MDFSILYIGKHDVAQESQELHDFVKSKGKTIKIIHEATPDNAFTYLLTHKVGLIIIDNDLENQPVDEFVKMIKNEAALRHIFILVLLPEYDIDKVKKILLNGADQVLTLEKLQQGMLFPCIRSLVLNAALMSEKISRTTMLQEKAITDFIMLDLIKDYVPKTLWKAALECAHLQKLSLPGEECEACVTFGDIAGFTKMSQHLSPNEIIANLNEVYEIVTRNIYAYNGDIDKFIGDAFFGIFSSPKQAVQSMLLIQKETEILNKKRKSENLPEIRFRIGIHTGSVIRGNVGGNNRYDNTLIGDTINTASRLEHIAPPGNVVISEATRKKLNLDIPQQYCFTEKLRGRDKKTQYYTVYNFLKDNKDFWESRKTAT